jgi:eukaryotic-like serine/threonine-protein kinase
MPDIPASASPAKPATPALNFKPEDTLGPYVLRQLLGRGSRTDVWLAWEPRGRRAVALKVLRASADVQSAEIWLAQARSASGLKHPSVLAVLDAAWHGPWACVALEYTEGKPLSAMLSSETLLPAQQMVRLAMDMLDALAVSHLEGVVHGDIRPGNVLVDASGRARLMDFGQADQPLSSPTPRQDVAACAALAEASCTGADPQLRSILSRAQARDTSSPASLSDELPDARALFGALDGWLHAAHESAAPAGSGSTVDFLLRRMSHKSDFPALSEAVVRIQSMASSETESVGSVTNEILKDVALTNKLLRVVNSAHYARGGSISTVSRAVTLVGFNGIRNMALSLLLLEHMQDKTHAAQLKEEFLRALMAAQLGAELYAGQKDMEEAFIGAMFQNLGRLLVQFYFPEEASQIRRLMQLPREALSEEGACVRVLGLSFEDLGLGVARAWALPAGIQRCMRKPGANPPNAVPHDAAERLRWVAAASNAMADALLLSDAPQSDTRTELVSRQYAAVLGRSAREVQAATERARQALCDMASAMEIHVTPDTPAARLLRGAGDEAADTSASGAPSTLGSLELQASPAVAEQAAAGMQRSGRVSELLAAGIQDITNAMVEDFRLSDVLRMILETMYRAMEFDRIIFCLRDPKTEMLQGRFGLGAQVDTLAKGFRSHLKAPTPDLFSIVCLKGADTMISDASDPRIVQRLPQWYLQSLNAPTFLLLPLQIRGAAAGLIYADKTARGSLELDDKELALLRTLRNQAIMALRQAG